MLDTLGLSARCVEDLELLGEVLGLDDDEDGVGVGEEGG